MYCIYLLPTVHGAFGLVLLTHTLLVQTHTHDVSAPWLKCPALPRVLIVNPAVYPRLVLNYDFTYFFILKWTHLSLSLKTKLRTFPWFSRGATNLRHIGQGVHELWSDIQTNKQRLLLNIFRYYLMNLTSNCNIKSFFFVWNISNRIQ